MIARKKKTGTRDSLPKSTFPTDARAFRQGTPSQGMLTRRRHAVQVVFLDFCWSDIHGSKRTKTRDTLHHASVNLRVWCQRIVARGGKRPAKSGARGGGLREVNLTPPGIKTARPACKRHVAPCVNESGMSRLVLLSQRVSRLCVSASRVWGNRKKLRRNCGRL